MIPLCVPSLCASERQLLLEALDSGFVSTVGPFVERFERALGQRLGTEAIACASGTAALHLALHAAGVRAGDVVCVQDFTFIASANPVVHAGATPVFIGSEAGSWNLDASALSRAIASERAAGRRVAAVIAVHIYGQPADLGAVLDVCTASGVPLIEDATEALGAGWTDTHSDARLAGRAAGSIGAFAALSFNGNKVITTGGGGMVLTRDAAAARAVRHRSTQAKLPGSAFVHDEIGWNYRLTNLAAALGLAQLSRLDDLLARKRALAARYRAGLPELAFQPRLPGTIANDWMPVVRVAAERRDAVLRDLDTAGIQARPAWLPLSRQPAYAGARRYADEPDSLADQLGRAGICLPCSADLSAADQEQVIAALRRALDLRAPAVRTCLP